MQSKKKASKNTKGTASLLDVALGNLIRQRRIQLGLSQEFLADSIGVSFQQVQKYERGVNRISFATFYQIMKVLKDDALSYLKKVDAFMDHAPAHYAGLSDNKQEFFISENIVLESEIADLLRAFYSIENAEDRRKILQYAKDIALKRSETHAKGT